MSDLAEQIPCVQLGHAVLIDSVGPTPLHRRQWFIFCNTCRKRLSSYAVDVVTALNDAAAPTANDPNTTVATKSDVDQAVEDLGTIV